MRKKHFVLCILFFSFFNMFALSPNITWNFGTVDVVWNQMTQVDDSNWSGDKMALSFVDVQFAFFEDRLGLHTSLFQFKSNEKSDSLFTFLPVEINFNLLKSNTFLFGPYARGEINFTDGSVDPFGEIGCKLGVLTIDDNSLVRYSWRCSLYVGYDTDNEINIGTQIDLGILGLLFLMGPSEETEYE